MNQNELFEKHRPDSLRTARRLMGQELDAEDAVQTAFLRASDSLSKLRDPALFPRWLRRIVVRTCLEMMRERKRVTRHVAALPLVAESLPTGGGEVRAAVGTLPEELRLPILLHYVEGFTYDKIAEILELPRGTVGTNIKRGLDRLRVVLGPAGAAAILLAFTGEADAAPTRPDVTLTILQNERNASRSLKTTCTAEADFRWNDRDENGI